MLIPLAWSPSAFVDHQPPYAGGAPPAAAIQLTGVSCPTTSLCVGTDYRGDVLTSTDPERGAATWHVDRIDEHTPPPLSPSLGPVSCPSASLCVAADSAGALLTSADPAARVWRVTLPAPATSTGPPFGGGAGVAAVSCPTVGFCVAADRQGNILTSSNPTAGVRSWKSVAVDHRPGFFGIQALSCPTRALCVAVDGNGDVITSTKPDGGASAWRVRNVDGSNQLYGVSCPSSGLCVAIDARGALTSTNPATATTWQHAVLTTQQGLGRLSAVSCPSASMCVVLDQSGDEFFSTNPTGGAATWTESLIEYVPFPQVTIPGLTGPSGLSCTSANFCMGVDAEGNALWSSDPAGGGQTWKVEQVDGANGPVGVSCPSTWCVAVDWAGNALTSSQPGDPASWTVRAVDPDGATSGLSRAGAVSCPSTALCAAVDGDANVLTSTDPMHGSGWQLARIDPNNTLAGISCASSQMCVAVDSGGNAVTSTHPAGGASSWSVTPVDNDVTTAQSQAALLGISCPSASLCAAIDSAGNVLTSRSPLGGPSAWTASDISGTGLTAMSCASASLCIATAGTTMFVSRNPADGVQTWSSSTMPQSVTSISCPSPSRCVATDGNGDVLTTDDPAMGAAAWTVTHLGSYLGAATCSPATCFAFDIFGGLMIGRQPTLQQLLTSPLQAAAIPSSRARDLPRLLARGGYSFTFTAPVPGRLRVAWRTASRGLLVAGGTAAFSGTAGRQVRVTLTRAGRRLLSHLRRSRIKARVSFTSGGRSVSITRTFSLR